MLLYIHKTKQKVFVMRNYESEVVTQQQASALKVYRREEKQAGGLWDMMDFWDWYNFFQLEEGLFCDIHMR